MEIQTTFSGEEQKQLEKLAIEAERNKSDAQRLALDAGKLLTVTSDRLNDYKDRGFFKRCWYKISGKQGSLDRANQFDLISMQKFAWAYLVKLQEQNILEAQAIAVLRNDLKDIQSETAEIHDMIAVIVEKFDARIKRLEESTAMLDWGNHVKATASKFETKKPCFCFLQLVFDCLDVMRRNEIKLGSVRVEEYLYTAMKELGLNPDASYTVEAFVSGLYEDVAEIGFGKFHDQIGLSIDEKRVESEYILDNVSGAGYNAIYQFDVEMAKMQNISKQLPVEVAKEAMLKTVRCSINNGATEYGATELAMEILGGSLLAEEIYRDEHGIKSKDEASPLLDEAGFNIDDLLGNYVTISDHAFLETMPSDEEKRVYLESFALVFATNGGYRESHYLTAIAKLFGAEDSLNRVELLTVNPKKLSVPDILAALPTDERKYAWCVDAMFIGDEDGTKQPRVRNAVLSMCKVFGFKENEIVDFLDKVETLVTTSDPKSLYDAIKVVNLRTQAWRNVVDFKRVSLKGAFDDLRARINKQSCEAMMLGLKVLRVSTEMSTSSCMFALGDENFVQRSAINLGRTTYILKFKKLKSEVEACEAAARSLLSDGNSVLSLFKTKAIHTDGGLSSIIADEASGIGNENWGDNMSSAFEKLSDYVTGISSAFDRMLAQIKLYEEGKYSESAEENAQKKKELASAQKAADRESKKVAKIAKDGDSFAVRFSFEKVSNLPFDFTKAKSCVRFGDLWLLVVDNECWSSRDGASWSKVDLPTKCGAKIKVVNGVCIIWGQTCAFLSPQNQEFACSRDGVYWFKGYFPDGCACEDVFYYRGKWMLQIKGSAKYSYKKEGVIWDSDETGRCDSTEWFFADDLTGPWVKDASMTFQIGYCAVDGGSVVSGDELIVVKSIDWLYASNKHITDRTPDLCYYSGKEWKRASIKDGLGETDCRVAKSLKTKSGILMSLNGCGILHSTDNHNWEKVSEVNASHGLHLVGDLVCAFGYGEHGETAYVSSDGRRFVPIVLDQRLTVVAFDKDTALFVDDNANAGGLFKVKVLMS